LQDSDTAPTTQAIAAMKEAQVSLLRLVQKWNELKKKLNYQ
jgi:hypothetical protein